MKKNLWMMAAVLAGASAIAIAQTAPDSQPDANRANQNAGEMSKPQADTGAAQQRKGAVIPVLLEKSIDSKKAKSGDQVEAKTTVPLNGANMSIPAGSKVIGHITDAKAKSKGDPQSSLSFEFDKIVVKKGQEVPFHAVAQAIGAPMSNPNVPYPDTAQGSAAPPTASAGSSAGHSGSAASSGSSAASVQPANEGTMPGNGGMAGGGSGQLGQDSTGVVGLKNLSLNSQANNSVISSDSKSVKLDGGTQLLLRALPQ